jgi:hypothetical protein
MVLLFANKPTCLQNARISDGSEHLFRTCIFSPLLSRSILPRIPAQHSPIFGHYLRRPTTTLEHNNTSLVKRNVTLLPRSSPESHDKDLISPNTGSRVLADDGPSPEERGCGELAGKHAMSPLTIGRTATDVVRGLKLKGTKRRRFFTNLGNSRHGVQKAQQNRG